MPPNHALGERLRRAREAAGLSQRELARLTEVTRNTISQVERGRRREVSTWTLARFADATGKTMDWLYGREGGPDGRA